MLCVNTSRSLRPEDWRSICADLGLTEALAEAKTVVVKPNLAAGSYADPRRHIMTDPALLASCVDFLLAENPGAAVYIAESDSTGHGFAYDKFRHLQLPEALGEAAARVRTLDLTRDRLRRIADGRFAYFRTEDRPLWLSETLLDADFLISLANVKTHAVAGYTGACKNLFGCLPESDKSVFHPYIHRVVHDMTLACPPALSVVDGFCAMEGSGPVQGEDVDLGFRVFSDSAVEADFYAAAAVGFCPMRIGYLARLEKTLGIALPSLPPVRKRLRRPAAFLRCMNAVGLGFQRCGQSIVAFGHRVHGAPNPGALLLAVFRPLLLRLFPYETLRAWKRRLTRGR